LQRSGTSAGSFKGKKSEEIKRNGRISGDWLEKENRCRTAKRESKGERQIRLEQKRKNWKGKERKTEEQREARLKRNR
jgi:hypothetical protein